MAGDTLKDVTGDRSLMGYHRIAQKRLELPGTTWTIEMAQALLNLRMMSIIGNDERFWEDPQMRACVAQAFNPGGVS